MRCLNHLLGMMIPIDIPILKMGKQLNHQTDLAPAGEGAKILEVGFNAGHSVCLMMCLAAGGDWNLWRLW